MKTIYECSQSKGIKWFTAIFFLIVIVAILLEMYFVSKGMNPTGAIIVTAVLLVASITCFLIFPMYIISDDEGIGVRTMLSTVRIPYENIDHIERVGEEIQLFGAKNTVHVISIGVKRNLFGASIRLFGVGGVFGYIGWFRTKGIGTFRSYVTDPKKAFLIYRNKGLPIAISVSEPDEFMPYYMKGGVK